MPATLPPPSFTGQRPAKIEHGRPQNGQQQGVGAEGRVEERTGAGQGEAPSGEILTPTSPRWAEQGLAEFVAALKRLPLEERARIAAALVHESPPTEVQYHSGVAIRP